MHRRAQQSPFMGRRLLTDAPVHLVEPSPDPVLLPALAALAKATTDPEIRIIIDAVPPALHPVMVDRMMGRQHLATALRIVLRVLPCDRLTPLGAERLSALRRAYG